MNDTASRDIKAYLYNASGSDESVELNKIDVHKLDENKLLWVSVLRRDEKLIGRVARQLDIDDIPVRSIVDGSSRPKIYKFGECFHFSINSIMLHSDGSPLKFPIDFVVGNNFLVTVHDGDVEYFVNFRKREKAETQFGELSAESFVAALLDLHVVSYFQALDAIEKRVDKLDSKILKKELGTDEFLAQMVGLRSDVSKLRRWLIPHRELIYGFLRADFQQIAKSDSLEQYKTLESHFENAVDAIESSRETVLSAFDLYATKSSQLTNVFIQRLTFLTLVTGTLGVIAGILGMNYQVTFFQSEYGFWITIAGMALVALALTVFARLRHWI